MVQIQNAEEETPIMDRFRRGGFETVEETLLQALKDAPLPVQEAPSSASGPSGPEILALFEASPHKDINLFPDSVVFSPSEPVEF